MVLVSGNGFLVLLDLSEMSGELFSNIGAPCGNQSLDVNTEIHQRVFLNDFWKRILECLYLFTLFLIMCLEPLDWAVFPRNPGKYAKYTLVYSNLLFSPLVVKTDFLHRGLGSYLCFLPGIMQSITESFVKHRCSYFEWKEMVITQGDAHIILGNLIALNNFLPLFYVLHQLLFFLKIISSLLYGESFS